MNTPSDPDTPQDTPQDASRDVRGDVLSAAAAARVAGVHTRSVRRAISEGRLVATMDASGAYRITPAALAAWRATRTTQYPGDATPDAGGGPPQDATGDAPGPVPPRVEAAMAAKDQTIGELAADVAYLRHHLDQVTEQLDQSRRELAVLHQSTAIRLEALTSGVGADRPDAPTTAPEPPGRDEGASEGDPSSWWTRTWRKVRGG